MSRGPNKQFDEQEALQAAMLLFWEKGFAATSLAELQARMGLGAKSLYDTFGNKRQLFLRVISHYTETVTRKLFDSLATRRSPLKAANNIMQTVARLDAGQHRGCLLGVVMAQAQRSDDEELAVYVEAQLRVIEDALTAAFERALQLGELAPVLDARDMARLYTAAFQGANLIARVRKDDGLSQGVSRALAALPGAAHR
ncbi:MAG: TetR/AcrR family transcriptional regulator [Pseudomonadota bacterium]